ncbi:hypothetical protein CYIG_00066 [Cyanophage NATL1A-7]|uniref:Predicted protein n=1 Tax=Cyanophage NATL1A-7 TaxID=445693 RepID=E3SND5_9CAUD|nr:hypothetical protein CYIG_00066 [Cyanophage NATL1A-7]ADP00139.1 predicted protein [Cyanophage NATL1A-7]
MSYEQNIQRLSQTSRFNTSQAQQFETENANNISKWHRDRANKVIDGLSGFSKILQKERKKQIEAMKREGAQLAREDRAVDAHRLLELEQLIPTLKEEDRNYHELKAEYIKLQGINAYPEADRLAKLSHYQQYGYTQERLKNAMDSYGDSLNYRMQNGETPYTLNGVTYTAKQIRANNIQSLPLKEALLEVEAAKLKEEMGLNKFSPEILELVGVNKTIDAAKSAYLGKVRKRYSIDSSAQTQAQSALAWKNSGKTGADIHHFLVTSGATVDKNGELLGNEGAWNAFMQIVSKEGIAMGDPSYADTIGNLPIPIELARKVGAKPGTTYAQHWPKRFSELKSNIKKGYVEVTNEELKFQKAEGTKLEAEFIEEARKGDLSSAQVNEWKRKFGAAGLPIPGGVTNYETASDRDQREDEDLIESLMASQNGYISNEQLDSFHPKAALKHRETASKLEKAALKEFGAEKKIKAHLDTAFTNMGIKGNEKSPAYIEAMENAKADYSVKYNQYIGMGYEPAQASHLALHAKEVKDKEGNTIPDSMGVLTEIKTNGEGSKYVMTGQSLEQSLKPGHLRVGQIKMAKDEILQDANSVTTKVIGGDYGHRQITTIKNNIDKYGPKGLYMDKGALAYYKGIARGRNPREGGYWGLVDAQLKALGHEGLNPDSRPAILDITTGKDKDGNIISDARGHSNINRSIARAMRNPSPATNLYIANMLKDTTDYGYTPMSVWDKSENLPDWYTVGGRV